MFLEIPQDDRQQAEMGMEQWEIDLKKKSIKSTALNAAMCKVHHKECLKSCRETNLANFKARFLKHAQVWRELYTERVKELTRCIDELAAG